MNHDWQEWIEKLGDKDLTEEEVRAFQEAMLENPDNVDAYLDELLPDTVIESDGLDKPSAPAIPLSESKPSATRFILPLAASVAVMVGAWSFFKGSETTPQVAHIATITNANSLSEATGLTIGQPLFQQSINLPEGAEIGVAMRDGALLEIHGPANFQLDSAEAIQLTKGRIATYAPEYAHGFTITTNDGKVVDLGTRFVTSTATDLGTEVHVQEGLVEAYTNKADATAHSLTEQKAVALKAGKLESIEYLEKRLYVPLDPNLVDSDGDGIADVVERHYGTNPNDSASVPAALRIEESFANYQSGPIVRDRIHALGFADNQSIIGKGNMLTEGLNYSNNGQQLLTKGGCVSTTGVSGVGIEFTPSTDELPKDGAIYMSFLMQQTNAAEQPRFAGLILDHADKEQLFVGELHPFASYGSRLKAQQQQDSFHLPADNKVHLFVIRIDQTRLLTDIFVDPPLGGNEVDLTPNFRYYDSPNFDKLILRSGSDSVDFPVKFDEIRSGLSWDAVLPLEK